MQNQQLPERIQRIIAHLQEVWQHPQPISPEDLKRITEFIVDLPEQYKKIGLEKLAGYATNTMSLHILNLMTIFQQYAEQEGISYSNVEDTLKYVLPDTFRVLADLDDQVRVQSLDDVATLTNITTNLQVLSSSDTAEEAQSWLYELPTMYYQQLSQEKLTVNTYTSAYMLGQQGLSGAPVIDPKTYLVLGVKGSSPAHSSYTFVSEEHLKLTRDTKDDSEGNKPAPKNILAA